MKRMWKAVLPLTVCVCFGGVIAAQNGGELFSQGLVKERTASYDEAIRLYDAAIELSGDDKKMAAKALYQKAQLLEMTGRPVEARSAYQRVVSRYADQREVASDATRRLAALTRLPADPAVPRVVMVVPSYGAGLVSASITADGRRLVLQDPDSGDALSRDLSSGSMRRLNAKGSTETPGRVEFAAMSPDQTLLAYIWNEDGASQLRVMPTKSGGTPRTLVDSRETRLNFQNLAWFPDGKFILGLAVTPDTARQFVRVRVSDGSSDIIRSMGQRIPRTAARPSLSPDGKYIAYAALASDPGPGKNLGAIADSEPQHIYVMAADGSGSPTELVGEASRNAGPVWTPDGRYVLYTSDVHGTFDLWSIPVRAGKSSGAPSVVLRDVGRIQPFGVAGGTYYYGRTRLDRSNGFIVADIATDGGTGSLRTSVSGAFPGDRELAWSPDGRSMAFYRSGTSDPRAFELSGRDSWDLIVRSLDGHERVFRNRDVHEQRGGTVQFLNNETLLTRVSTAGSANSIYTLDLKSAEFSLLSANQASDAPRRASGILAASPTGRRLYFTIDAAGTGTGKRLLSLDLGTRQQRDVINFGNRPLDFRNLMVSPDGLTLALVLFDSRTSRRSVALLREDGSDYRETPLILADGESVLWAPDSRALLLVRLGDGLAELRPREGLATQPLLTRLVSVDIETLREKELMNLSSGGLFRGRPLLSVDGSRLVINVINPVTSRWSIAVLDIAGSGHREFPLATGQAPSVEWLSGTVLIATISQQTSRSGGTGRNTISATQLVRIDTTTGRVATAAATFDEPVALLSVSPDGARAVFRSMGDERNEVVGIKDIIRFVQPR